MTIDSEFWIVFLVYAVVNMFSGLIGFYIFRKSTFMIFVFEAMITVLFAMGLLIISAI